MTFRVLDALFFDELNQAKLAPVEAVPTGFPTWDVLCRDEGGGVGIARGWQVIVAGNPGLGKSALALNMIAAALHHGETVGLISLEMSMIQLATRLMAIISGISLTRLEHGRGYSSKDAASAAGFFKMLWEKHNAKVIVSEDLHSLDEIELGVDQLIDQGCRYVVIDYLQLVNSNEDDAVAKVTNVARRTRRLAHMSKIVVLSVSQLTREAAKSKDPPTPQGLYGGAALEQSADQVVLLDHTTYVRHDGWRGTTSLIIGKNRHGAQGEIPIAFDYRTLRIQEHHED